MREFGPKQLVLIALAVVVGLVLGGLGPRSEARALRARLAAADEKACDRDVGRELARVFQGRPWSGDGGARGPAPEAEADPQGGVRITVGGEEVGADDEEGLSPDVTVAAMRDAMELRRTQSEAALREQAGATDAQMATVDAIVDAMNAELDTLASEFVETVSGGEPSRRELMLFAADTLDVLLSTEDQLGGVLDADQRAAVDEEVTDPLSFVDGRIVEILAEIDP